MANSRQLRHLATNPHAFAKFHLTGRLPEMVKPTSPLIMLLESIAPRDRVSIIGLRMNQTLGYSNNVLFHSAEAALRWLKPDVEMLAQHNWPAESCRNKGFNRRLSIDELLREASSYPAAILARYPHLRDPKIVQLERSAAHDADAPVEEEPPAPEADTPLA